MRRSTRFARSSARTRWHARAACASRSGARRLTDGKLQRERSHPSRRSAVELAADELRAEQLRGPQSDRVVLLRKANQVRPIAAIGGPAWRQRARMLGGNALDAP